MKISAWWASIAIVCVVQWAAGSARAGMLDFLRQDDKPDSLLLSEPAPRSEYSPPTAPGEWNHDSGGERSCWASDVFADSCPPVGFYAFSGFESWRGVSDATSTNNGFFSGFNLGAPLPLLSDRGFGVQAGAVFGGYDWTGRATNGPVEANQWQQQALFTLGFFRRAGENSRISGGLVYDWMINENFGSLAQEPNLGQWRGQLAYALSGANEVGLWGSLRGSPADTRLAGAQPIRYRSVNQLNVFWHRKFCECGADSWLWAGLVDHNRLNGLGSLGDWTVGGAVNVPISNSWALFSNLQYMHPSARPGSAGSTEGSCDLQVGVAWYPGGYARSSTVAGRTWMPLLPVANNGNFLVDRSP